MSRPIRLGMVGGGIGGNIGPVHRIAARLDGRYTLTAGALSSRPEVAGESAAALGLDPARSYTDYRQMAIREARLKDGIEAVAIVTPNHLHYPVAREFLKRGIHVICDKPLTATLAEARKMQQAVEKSDALFMLTHTYSGYPMMRQAREMVANGDLGAIRLVNMEYVQDWMAEDLPGNKQAEWRTDPAQSGAGGSIGDIGTHALQMGLFVSGLTPDSLSADLHSFVPGRVLDDNAHVMLRFAERDGVAARGTLWCSQVAAGEINGLRLRIYGTKGGLEWSQEDPERLWFMPLHGEKRLITRGSAGTGPAAARLGRVPGGHPEGYLEAFANLYSETADAIEAHREGRAPAADVLFPGIEDGMMGMRFVDACVRSSKRDGAWIPLQG